MVGLQYSCRWEKCNPPSPSLAFISDRTVAEWTICFAWFKTYHKGKKQCAALFSIHPSLILQQGTELYCEIKSWDKKFVMKKQVEAQPQRDSATHSGFCWWVILLASIKRQSVWENTKFLPSGFTFRTGCLNPRLLQAHVAFAFIRTTPRQRFAPLQVPYLTQNPIELFFFKSLLSFVLSSKCCKIKEQHTSTAYRPKWAPRNGDTRHFLMKMIASSLQLRQKLRKQPWPAFVRHGDTAEIFSLDAACCRLWAVWLPIDSSLHTWCKIEQPGEEESTLMSHSWASHSWAHPCRSPSRY